MRAIKLEERLARPPRAALLLIATAILLFASPSAFAGSGTWLNSPIDGNWNSAPNWSPMTVPNGSSDTATFGSSSVTDISLSADTEVNGIVFNPGASAFTITASPTGILTVSGAGIINNSGVVQNFAPAPIFHARGDIIFRNNATAGSMTLFTSLGEGGGFMQFFDASTAGSATIINQRGGSFFDSASRTDFIDASTAGRATIINEGGMGNSTDPGRTIFFGGRAGEATIINNGGAGNRDALGGVTFFDAGTGHTSSAGSATLIANGGTGGGQGGGIVFLRDSTGATARAEVFGNGFLDLERTTPRMVIGSIEGTGNVFLGGTNLSVGSNGLSTVFSGQMQGGTRGSLTKIGAGTLTLSGANTYTGGTTISGGVLQVENTSGSGTGSGPVAVGSGGKLAGSGTIGGDVINNGVVAPGDSPGTLHVGGNYSQGSGATLEIEIASLFSFDQLIVSGTATLSGTLDVSLDGYTGHAGDMFTILTSSGLSGNFLNLDLPELSEGLFFTEKIRSNDVLLTVSGSTGVSDSGSTLLLLAGALGALLGLQRFIISQAKSI